MVDVDPRGDLEPLPDARRGEDLRQRPSAVVVAGMHRSGTSALARVLSLLGLDLPKVLYAARPDNPLGYWEPEQVIEAHEQFLEEVGSSMDDFLAIDETALRGPAARKLEDRLVEVLAQEFGGSQSFVVKDPRICRVIPVWIAALTRFGAEPLFVLPVRNPLEVAASLKLRNEYGTTKSLLLWLRHVLEAEHHTRNHPRSIVSYEALLREWQPVVDKVSRELGLVWPRMSHTAYAEIEQFLSPRRRHHAAELVELAARPDVVDWVKATYEVLAAAAGGEELEQDVLDAIRGELDRADRAFGPLVADLRLTGQAQERALSEQTAELMETRAEAERQGRELADRNRAAAEAKAETERLSAELARQQEALATATSKAENLAGQLDDRTREFAEQLSEQTADLEETRAEAERQARELEEARAEGERHARELVEARAEGERHARELVEARAEGERRARELADRNRAAAEAKAESERLSAELARHHEALATARSEAENLAGELDDRNRELARLSGKLAEREVAIARLQRPRSVRLRAKLRALSTLASWLARPHRGGWGYFAMYFRIRRAGTFRPVPYLVANPDVDASGRNPLMHYIEHGAREGRALGPGPAQPAVGAPDTGAASSSPAGPAPMVPVDPDVIARLQRPRSVRLRAKLRSLSTLASWLARPHRGGWHHFTAYLRIRRAGTFRPAPYLVANPDVAASGLNPLMHYIEHGTREGRALGPGPAQPEVAAQATVAASSSPAGPAPVEPRVVPSAVVATRVVSAPPSGPLPAADYSDFVVLLSRQRSGTNALRSILETHPDVFCFNEVFNLPDRDAEEPFLRESNFFTFVERYAGGDVRQILPDNHERLFLDFLDYLRCLSDKRYAVIDVKYNQTHFLATTWLQGSTPHLFELAARHRVRALNVTRKNYLRYVLSNLKALQADIYTVEREQSGYVDRPQHVDPGVVIRQTAECAEEDRLISRYLRDIGGQLHLEFDYADLFPGDGVVVAPDFLSTFSAWLGISNQFDLDPHYRKLSSLPLHEAIENFDEIATALRDTQFAYCLDDEPAYRAAATRS